MARRKSRRPAKKQKTTGKRRTSATRTKRGTRKPAKRKPARKMLKGSQDVLTGGIYAGDPTTGHIPDATPPPAP